MSEPTVTRKTLRRRIAMELQMPFFRRFAAGESAMTSGSTTVLIKDTALRQAESFWTGSWFYDVGSGLVSLIRKHSYTTTDLSLETALASTPNVGDKYEIHSVWNAAEIHNAINRAIDMVGRTFPETIVDETLILKKDILAYDLTGLTKKVFQLNKVWVENPATISRMFATAGGASSITLPSLPSGIGTSWKISIYDGTGAGQIRNYASAVGNVVTVNSAWVTQPDATSEVALWDTNDQQYDWIPMHTVYVDAKEYPDSLRLRGLYTTHYGMRMRLEYLTVPAELTTDADTTVVPMEYLVPKACALLHGQKLKDTRADRDMHFSENQRYDGDAERFLLRNAPHTPDTNIKAQYSGSQIADTANPLNW